MIRSMQHSFHMRPSDSFVVGATKVSLVGIKSSRLVTVNLTVAGKVTRVPLALGTPVALEPGVTLALDPNTSRPSMNAILLVTAPDALHIDSPE